MGRIAPDGYDVLVYLLDKTTGPNNNTFVNSGTAGSSLTTNWTLYGGANPGQQGIFGDALYVPGSVISSNHDGAGGANNIAVSPNVSLSGWIYLRRYVSATQEIMVKQYFSGAWNNPWLTIGMQILSNADGTWEVYVSTAATLRILTISSNDGPIPVGRWSHIGMTWNGATSTITVYLNGTAVKSATTTGSIDYNTSGSPGQWFVGAVPDSTTVQAPPIIFQDIRVANIVRPQSYFANIYYNGMTP